MKRERRNFWTETVAAQDRPRKPWREVASEAYLRAASERLGAVEVVGAETLAESEAAPLAARSVRR